MSAINKLIETQELLAEVLRLWLGNMVNWKSLTLDELEEIVDLLEIFGRAGRLETEEDFELIEKNVKLIVEGIEE